MRQRPDGCVDAVIIDRIEPIVRLMCYKIECQYRLKDHYCCTLKHIFITEDGQCGYSVPVEEDNHIRTWDSDEDLRQTGGGLHTF